MSAAPPLLSIDELQDRVAVMLGGRSAEHLIIGTISTGASDDIERATQLARRMVTEFGMSEKLGSVRYAGQRLQYMGGTVEDTSDSSAETRAQIDDEVRRIIREQASRAERLLAEHREVLTRLAAELLKAETLDGNVVRQALTAASV